MAGWKISRCGLTSTEPGLELSESQPHGGIGLQLGQPMTGYFDLFGMQHSGLFGDRFPKLLDQGQFLLDRQRDQFFDQCHAHAAKSRPNLCDIPRLARDAYAPRTRHGASLLLSVISGWGSFSFPFLPFIVHRRSGGLSPGMGPMRAHPSRPQSILASTRAVKFSRGGFESRRLACTKKTMNIKLGRIIRHRFPVKSRDVFCATLWLLALGWAAEAHAQSFQDLINEAHSQRDRYAGWRPPVYEHRRETFAEKEANAWAEKMADQDSREAARVAREKAHFDSLNVQAGEAFDRHDRREGLRLLEELRIAHRDAGIYSPTLKEAIGRNEALLAWGEAKTAADYRRAIAFQPYFFTLENLRFVERLEVIEEYVRQRPEHAAKEQAALLEMRTMIDKLASTLADPRQSARPVLDHGTEQGAEDGFGTRKSDPKQVADDGTSGEHESVRSSLGFDTPGQLYIKERSAPPPTPIGRVVVPEKFGQHPAVRQLREYEATAAEAKRIAAAKQARYEDEAASNPNSNALLVLRAGAKDAQSRADNAEHMVTFQIKEIERTVTFAPFATGNSTPSPVPPPLNSTAKEQP